MKYVVLKISLHMHFIFHTSLDYFWCIKITPLTAYPLLFRKVLTWKLNMLLFSICFAFCFPHVSPQEWHRAAQPRPQCRPFPPTDSQAAATARACTAFPSHIMKDPKITGNVTHHHCWACPGPSQRCFPSLRQSIITRGTSRSSDNISNDLTFCNRRLKISLVLLVLLYIYFF